MRRVNALWVIAVCLLGAAPAPAVDKQAPVVGKQAPVVGKQAPVVGKQAPVAGNALSSWKTGSEPLQIDAHSMDIKGADNLVIFEGDVAARQGELTLHADHVEVRADPKTRELQTVHATGSVRLHKGDIVASGDQADYDAVKGVAVLTGTPKVWRDKDVVAGDRITLYLAEDRSVVEGAKAVLYPAAKTEGKEAKPAPKTEGGTGK